MQKRDSIIEPCKVIKTKSSEIDPNQRFGIICDFVCSRDSLVGHLVRKREHWGETIGKVEQYTLIGLKANMNRYLKEGMSYM